ncbi:hypothetical protein [Modestobacter excelsi]|uniref:hypothetical protein n=1 Tax=Modestobacter excelsi TaxID=2213161 RepID=UPI00110CA3BF|nr:hypothetical protein [Modestobacter excelsi]
MSDPDPDAGPTAAATPPPSRRGVLLPSLDRAVAVPLVQALGHHGWLVPWSAGGVVFVADVPAAVALASAASHEVAGQVAVVLWADPGAPVDPALEGVGPEDPVAGLVVVRRGHVLTSHSWDPDGAVEVGNAAVLAAAVDQPDLEVGARALLRRPSPVPQAALAELADLLGLPPAALALLRAPALPPATEHVPALTGRRRLRAFGSAVATRPEPTWAASLRRWQFLLPAGVATWFTVRATAAALAGNAPDDARGYGALALVGTGAALWRARRDRRDRDAA